MFDGVYLQVNFVSVLVFSFKDNTETTRWAADDPTSGPEIDFVLQTAEYKNNTTARACDEPSTCLTALTYIAQPSLTM